MTALKTDMKQALVRITNKIKEFTHRGAPLTVAGAWMVSLLLVGMPIATAATVQNLKPAPRVSFTFDDGISSALTNAAPTLAKYGIAGTSFIITGCVGMTTVPNTCAANQNVTYMTWDQIAQLKAYGWEIGSHTVTHPQLALADGAADGSLPGGAAQVVQELVNSRQALADHGYDASDFAFPYGDYDNNALAQVAKYYASARGFADLGYNTFPYTPSLIVTQQVQGPVTVAQVEAYVDQAITNNQWLVLTFHDIEPNASTVTADYQYSTANLDAIAAYVKQKEDASQIKAVTIDEGLIKGTNMLANGDFKDGIADGWTTDDPTNITADANNNGRYPDPTNSISLKSTATATTDTHLFSPQVAVSAGTQYILKNYVNILSGGEVDFYVDEYDANHNWVSGQYTPGISYGSAATAINVKDLNFAYTPTTSNVAYARLQVIVHGANVNAYYDGAQWLSSAEVADTTPPVISNVTVTNITQTSATVNWTTDEASDSNVKYGTSASYGSTASDATMTTSHSVNLTGLTAGGSYHFQVTSTDASGNVAASQDFLFAAGLPVNTTPPTITNVAINTTDASDATITWSTNEPAASQLAYGTTTSYGTTLQDATLSVGPTFSLSGLSASTAYYFQVTSTDAYGNSSTYTGTFTTPSSATIKVGDVNNDGTVDALDLSIVLSDWNMTGATYAQGDLNHDGTVDALDLSTVLSNWSN
jgi:peptidoglycan/xylan/chitin deacetylase (PgdA/CDA1 family)